MTLVLQEGVAHAILDGSDFFCVHCGAREKVLPIALSRIRALEALGLAFAAEHEDCVETDTSPSRLAASSPTAWLNSGDTGLSSATIWSVMTEQPFPLANFAAGAMPADADDFGRCHRLLERFPGWRPRMPEVAAKHPGWSRLVEAWERLTAVYVQEGPAALGRALERL
jgi:hypothetical protein